MTITISFTTIIFNSQIDVQNCFHISSPSSPLHHCCCSTCSRNASPILAQIPESPAVFLTISSTFCAAFVVDRTTKTVLPGLSLACVLSAAVDYKEEVTCNLEWWDVGCCHRFPGEISILLQGCTYCSAECLKHSWYQQGGESVLWTGDALPHKTLKIVKKALVIWGYAQETGATTSILPASPNNCHHEPLFHLWPSTGPPPRYARNNLSA